MRYCFCLAAVLAAPLTVGTAQADGALVPGESVVDRARPELDAAGLPLGAFRLKLSADLTLTRDSNVFAQDQGEIDDRLTVLSPRMTLESGWSRHALEVRAQTWSGRYADNGSEDYDDWSLAASGRLDVSRAAALRLAVQADSLHEDRYSPDDVDGIEPTPYDRRSITAGYARRSGRLALRMEAGLRNWDYRDVASTTGIVNNDDRDRAETSLELKVGYEVRPQMELFARALLDQRDYDDAVDDNGLDRSSDGFAAALGVQAALTGATYVEAFAGYTQRDYDDAALAGIDTPWFGGRVVWNPTGLTTVTLEGMRAIEETTFDLSSGYRSTRVGASLDHELRRNVLLRAEAYAQTNDYEGLDRKDDITFLSVGASYLMNRYLRLSLDLTRRERDSSLAAGSDYTIDMIHLTVRAQR